MAKRGVPGVQVTTVEYDPTGRENIIQYLLSRTDIIDADYHITPFKAA